MIDEIQVLNHKPDWIHQDRWESLYGSDGYSYIEIERTEDSEIALASSFIQMKIAEELRIPLDWIFVKYKDGAYSADIYWP